MKQPFFKKALPHIAAVIVFLIVAAIYCMPAMEGKVLQQHDNIQWKGMSHDAFNYHDRHGFFPLWTNNMFSGMPSFQVASNFNNALPYYVGDILTLRLPKPVNYFFLACICFYFLLSVLRVNNIIRIMGALAFAYATYDPVIIAAGHDTKMLTMCYLPAFIGSLIMIYEGRYWLGMALTGIFTCQVFAANHQQIAYYGFIIALIVSISYAVIWIKQKNYKRIFLSAGAALLAVVLGVLVNASILFTLYDYSKATIRDGSVLKNDADNNKNGGLPRDYAFSYSMYKSEPLVMMFPGLYGGSSDKEEKSPEDSKAMEALASMPQQLQQQLQYNYQFYWGGIGSTSGPVYLSAIICFLAIIGMFILDDRHKWWICTVVFLAIIMSWGGYFESFNGWLLDNLPFYNKFRAPSMTMVMPQLLLPVLACLSLDKILNYSTLPHKAVFEKHFKQGLIAVAVVMVFPLMMYISSDFYSLHDHEVLKQVQDIADTQVKEPILTFFKGLKEDRQSLLLSSFLRAFFLCALAAGFIYLYIKGKFKPLVLTLVFTITVFIDLMSIDVKYLNKENYLDKEESENTFAATPADLAIVKDTGFYRVFNTTGDIFNDALTSYTHHSVGGYHPAKLSIYQDLIANQLSKQPANMAVFDMLNTRYFITGNSANPQPQRNPGALGNAWFVNHIVWVDGPNEEMKALDHFNPRDTAIAEKQFRSQLKFEAAPADSSATITLVNNDNDYIEYSSSNTSNGFGVFSEIYYDRGWKAFIDGQETPIIKVNYVLRGLSIPAGKHKIEFRFEPKAYILGSHITSVAQILVLLLLAAGIFADWRRKKVKPNPSAPE